MFYTYIITSFPGSSMVRAVAHGALGRRIDPSSVDPWSYFSFQPVLHDWCNKGCGMYYPVCGILHIKETLLLIGKSSLLSEWSLTICLTPCNCKYNVLSALLNKTFPSFLHFRVLYGSVNNLKIFSMWSCKLCVFVCVCVCKQDLNFSQQE